MARDRWRRGLATTRRWRPSAVDADGRHGRALARASRSSRGYPNPAAAIGTWLTLAAWTGHDVWGGAATGYCHRAELVRATLAELPDLLAPAQPGELWIDFELTTAVDLNDDRFTVERIDRGSLVPASCKLTLR